MIQRYQRILFLVLLAGSVILAVLLFNHQRHNYTLRDNAGSDAPIEAPSYAAAEAATLDLANDSEGSVAPAERQLALPTVPAVRARALLEHLLAEYTLPGTAHPVGGGIAVEDVYLIHLPLTAPPAKRADGTYEPASAAAAATPETPGTSLPGDSGELAVINLRSSWCDAHPSGITVETLTVDSILGTLHANMPQITKVRFLVDGQPRPTLAGNVELDRTYDVVDTANVTQVSHE